MEVANTLAYYDMATITAVKSFIVQATGNFRVDMPRVSPNLEGIRCGWWWLKQPVQTPPKGESCHPIFLHLAEHVCQNAKLILNFSILENLT